MQTTKETLSWMIILQLTAAGLAAAAFPDARRLPPPGWTGHVFAMSQGYPTTKPVKTAPWASINFTTQPEQYIRAVLAYAIDGNVAVAWDVQNNTVRKWYHVPWMHPDREFVRGLTVEKTSVARYLHPNQTTPVRNYAVGMYNPLGGYTLGQVWLGASAPDLTKAKFPVGSVSFKLLFTEATTNQVPFLKNSLEWQIDTGTSTSATAPVTPTTVRLLQVDLAVRDSRRAGKTGWVFGTFIYDGDAPGATVCDRLVPVGLMWGNDPTVTPSQVESGTAQLQQSWINPVALPTANPQLMTHLGWAGRLNGPVDNKNSSCLSCHSTAQWMLNPPKMFPPAVPPATEAMALPWFRNIKAGKPFSSGAQSLDYSLQMSVGVRNYQDSLPKANRTGEP